MPTLMPNIRLLRDDLRNSGWYITGFPFSYNGYNYSVVFEVLDEEDRSTPLAIAALTFNDDDNQARKLRVEANSAKLYASISTLRAFFHIQYVENLGDLFAQFYNNLACHIPPKAPTHYTEKLKTHIMQRLALRENDNPNARYCYDVHRNGIDPRTGKQMHRRAINAERARIGKEDLYEDK